MEAKVVKTPCDYSKIYSMTTKEYDEMEENIQRSKKHTTNAPNGPSNHE